MSRRITIYDVAARAGVSISTVSLAMNSPTRVSQAMRTRVYEAADALGFEPKTEAVARARRGVGRIGVLAPFSSYPSFYARLNGVFAAARDHPTEIVLFDHRWVGAASPLLSSLPRSGGRLDGLIVMGVPMEQAVADRLRESPMAIVLVEGRHDHFDSVRIDNVAGGRLAADHLVERGYESFGFVGEAQRSHRYRSPSEKRLQGFRERLEELGKLLHPQNIALIDLHADPDTSTHGVMPRLLRPPAALFAHSDTLAARVLREIRSRGIRVPHDLGLMGFDDSELATSLDLTSIRQPLHESGKAAVELLLDRLRNPDAPEREISLKLQLTPRLTTATHS
ncbi:LacI family DNA-binding transcriptional regulator [Acrocarpospora macrocephala]|uniref:LacI family transcriptional regulator n=1 Tax=Acrocarpospora macrocephala TaxID=150177 RepID=A0A5M3WIV8_9ACTN|nr:LacI family DNA-binding transcriptional regulator [Acrocarpospora macrocephala]GES06953.1 LacI family transcriptional regulator [Acrocarpospora macrocephala]